MAYNPYAAVADVLAYIGAANPPANPPYDNTELTRLITRAQDLIDAELVKYAFSVDTLGNPTDTDVLAALKTAVCAQVETWVQTGDELDELGQWQQFSVEGVSMSRRNDTKEIRRHRLCDRARDALRSTYKLNPWVGVN